LKDAVTTGGSENGKRPIKTADQISFSMTEFNILKFKVSHGETVPNFTLRSLMSTVSTFTTWKSTPIFSNNKKFTKERAMKIPT